MRGPARAIHGPDARGVQHFQHFRIRPRPSVYGPSVPERITVILVAMLFAIRPNLAIMTEQRNAIRAAGICQRHGLDT